MSAEMQQWRTPKQIEARAAARAKRAARRSFAGQLGGAYSWQDADEREAAKAALEKQP
jgi:hypothetical protein